jgi:hypothetical protein
MEVPTSTTQGSPASSDQGLGDWTMEAPPTAAAQDVNAASNWVETPPDQIPHTVLKPANASAPEGFWDRAKNWASGIWDSTPVQLALALSPHQALKNVYGKLPGPLTQKVSDVLGYPIPGVMNAIGEGAHILGNTRLIAPVAGTTPRELEKHLPEGVQQTINDIGVKLEHFMQGNATVGGGLQLGGLIAANLIPAVGEAADADAAANIADEAGEAASAVRDATEGAAPPAPAPGTPPVADPQSAAEGAANAVKDAVEGTPQTPGVPGAPGQPAVEGELQPPAPAEAAGEPPAPEAPTAPATGEPPSEEDEAEEEEPKLRKLKAPQKPPKEFGPLTKAIARSPVGRYLLEHPNLLKAAKYIKTGADLGFSYEMGKGVISDERGIQEDLKEQNYPKAVADILGITVTGAGAILGAKEGIGETIGHVFHTDPTALDILRAKHDGDLQLAIAQTHRIAQEITKLHLSPMDQEAVKFYINAGGDKATLQNWAEQLSNVPADQVNPDVKDVALEAINRAINDTGQIKATADTLTKFLAHIHAEGRAVDYFQKPPRPNYFPQGTAWDDENGNPTVIDEEEGAPVRPPKRGGGTLKDVKSPTLQRIFPTYFDGIMAGQRPSYIPLHTALMEYANDVLPSIATRRFVADLRGTDAGDGRPIAVQGGMVLNPTAEEGPVLVDPRGMPKPHIVQNGFDLPEIGKGEPGNEPPPPKGGIEVKKPVVPEDDEPSGPRVEPVAGILRAHNKFASTLWLSDDAFDELMKHVAQATPGFSTLGYGHIQGIHIPPTILRDILARPDLSDSLRDLVTDALNHSDYSKGAGIAAVRDSLEHPLREVVENEEQAHALQGALGRYGGAVDALSDPAAQRALASQVKFAVKGYNNAALPVQAAEAGAKLLAGRYAELGLTQSQGELLLNRYIFELEKEHGETKLREAASRAPDEIGRKITDFLDYRSGGKAPAGASGADVAEQQSDPLKLLGAREVREISREVAAQAHATGATAFNFKDGLIEPRKGFAVPVYPERTEAFPEGAKHSGEMMRQFLEKNRDIFARDPDATLTVLPHPGHGFSLEISHIEDDRGAAVKAAKENRRAGVLDLQTNKPVPTGIEAPKPGIKYIRSGADRYNKYEQLPQIGGENLPTPKNVSQIAEAYEKLKHQPFDAATKTAYDSLRRDIEHQWDYLTKGLGIKMQPWRGEGEPYASPAEMWEDVKKNHRLRFKNDTNILDTHPLYGINPKSGTTYINMLGALHDVLGHAAAHLGDTLEDRDTAYQRHAQMFSPESRGAFATEIRGRDAAIEAGKDVGPRKAGLLPEELRGRGEVDRFPAAKEPIVPKVSTDEERMTRAMLRDRMAREGETEISLSHAGKGEEEPTDLPASSVRDEKGNLRTVYHGTRSPKIFDLKDISFDGPPAPEEDEDGDFIAYGSGNDPSAYMGAHFAEEPKVASDFASGNVWNVGGLGGRFDGPDEELRPRVIPAKLDIKHPMVYDKEDDLQASLMEGKINDENLLDEAMDLDYNDGTPRDQNEDEFREEWYKKYDEDPKFRAEQNKWILNHSFDDNPEETVEAARDLGHQFREKLQAQGYDGVKYANNVEGGTSWIAFEPDQVHSAFPFEAAAKDAVRKASGVRGPTQMDLPLETPASSEAAETAPKGAANGARSVSVSGSGTIWDGLLKGKISDRSLLEQAALHDYNNDFEPGGADEGDYLADWHDRYENDPDFRVKKNSWILHHYINGDAEKSDEVAKDLEKQLKARVGGRYSRDVKVTPKWLYDSKPRFGYRSENYKLDFEDNRDKALYTIAQGTKNKMHDAAMEWLRKQFPGDSDDEIRAKGAAVRERVKKLAATMPLSDTLRIIGSDDDVTPEVRKAIEDGGAKVNGKMRRLNGKPPLILFTDPKTNDTLSLPEDEVSKDAVASKLAAKRAQFEEAQKKNAPEAAKESEQAPVPKVAKEAAGAVNNNKPPVKGKPPVAPPSWLRGSKPRFGYGSANYKLDFEDDRDKALYTVAQATKNRMHDAAMEWLRKQFPGESDGEIRARGMAVRERIKRLAEAKPRSDTLRVARTGGDVAWEDAASKLGAKRAQFEEAQKKAAGAGNGNKPPVEAKPPVAPEEQEPPKPNKGRKSAPIFDTSDYKDINHPALRKWKFLASRDGNPILLHADMKIHPDFYKAVKNYVEDGGFESPALRKALQLTTLVKNLKIFLAPFHRLQEGTRGEIAGLGDTIYHPPDINPDDPVVARLLHNSLKLYDSQGAADFGSEGLESETYWEKQIKKYQNWRGRGAPKPTFEDATRKWRSEEEQSAAAKKLAQGMGKFLGKGLFGPGGYIPRLKAALAVKEFNEYMASHPTADPDLVAWHVSHYVNSAFGLMNWKVLGASAKHMELARLISFAPDFLSSEVSLFGSALNGDWRAQKLLLRNIVLQVLATRAATMVIALMEHPQQTLKNPVAAMNLQHPMSVKLGNGDLLMPRTPLTDALNLVRNPAQFGEYRTSPLLDAARGAVGYDYAGHKLKGLKARAESVGSSLEPMFMQGVPTPSAVKKSLLRSVGLDQYRDYSPAERLAFSYDAGDAGDEPETADQRAATAQEMKLISGLRPKNLGGRGDMTVADVRQAFKSGKITGKQMLTIMRDAEKPAIVAAVTHLTVPQILKVMSVASPQEGVELVPPLLRKLVGLSVADPQQFRALQPLVRQAIKAARVKKAHELIQQ